jgi:hypothetical protein
MVKSVMQTFILLQNKIVILELEENSNTNKNRVNGVRKSLYTQYSALIMNVSL